MLHPPFALVLSHDVTPCWQDIHHWHSTAQLSWETRVVEERHASHSYFTASISINTSTNTYGRTRHQNPKFTIFQIWGIHPKIWGPPHPPPLHFDVWRTTQSSLSSLQSMLKCLFRLLFSMTSSGWYKGLNYRVQRPCWTQVTALLLPYSLPPWNRSIQSTPSHQISLRSNLI